jgi:hypothetical protein
MDGKIEELVSIKFCVKLGKSAAETYDMLHEAFGQYSLSHTAALDCIYVSRPVECQLKMMKVQGDQALAKRKKKLKKILEFVHEDCHLQTSLGLVMEFARKS